MEDLAAAIGLHRAGRFAEAEAACRAIFAADPNHGQAWHLLGVLAHKQGRTQDGVTQLSMAAELLPDSPEILSNLAGVLGVLERYDEAAVVLSAALKLRPGHPEAWNNLGVTHERLGRLAEAEQACRQAIALKPGYADAHNNLGQVLRKTGRAEDAVVSHLRANAVRPNDAATFDALGAAYTELGNQAEAIASYRRSVALKPSASVHSNLLYTLHNDPGVTPEQLFAEHLEWARLHETPLKAHWQPRANSRDPHRRLRVGYVSADFRRHPTPRFVEPLLARHDRDAFEVFCYSDVRQPDEVTARLTGLADVWRDTSRLDAAALAGLVRDDRIDLLVDLTGHTAGNRLPAFALKPAPVQVSCIGYVDTTGLAAMDYRITDALADPPGRSDRLSTERLVRLPGCAWCCRPEDGGLAVGPPPMARTGRITFGCLNRAIKITPPMLALWSQILSRVPGSTLLLSAGGGEAANPALRARAESCGVPPGCLRLADRVPHGPYLARYHEIDVALDTFPFTGVTTTCDALWMGVPVVTLAGDRQSSRIGASLLTAAGLGDFIASTPEQYVELAVALACDMARLAELRAGLRGRLQASPVCDELAFCRHVEEAYRAMWAGWRGNRG